MFFYAGARGRGRRRADGRGGLRGDTRSLDRRTLLRVGCVASRCLEREARMYDYDSNDAAWTVVMVVLGVLAVVGVIVLAALDSAS